MLLMTTTIATADDILAYSKISATINWMWRVNSWFSVIQRMSWVKMKYLIHVFAPWYSGITIKSHTYAWASLPAILSSDSWRHYFQARFNKYYQLKFTFKSVTIRLFLWTLITQCFLEITALESTIVFWTPLPIVISSPSKIVNSSLP